MICILLSKAFFTANTLKHIPGTKYTILAVQAFVICHAFLSLQNSSCFRLRRVLKARTSLQVIQCDTVHLLGSSPTDYLRQGVSYSFFFFFQVSCRIRAKKNIFFEIPYVFKKAAGQAFFIPCTCFCST